MDNASTVWEKERTARATEVTKANTRQIAKMTLAFGEFVHASMHTNMHTHTH